MKILTTEDIELIALDNLDDERMWVDVTELKKIIDKWTIKKGYSQLKTDMVMRERLLGELEGDI